MIDIIYINIINNKRLTATNIPNNAYAVETALSVIGGRWKLKIYKTLRRGAPVKFSNISRALNNVSEKALNAQLNAMEKDGILGRIVSSEMSPYVNYKLIDEGASFRPHFYGFKKLAQRLHLAASQVNVWHYLSA